MPTLGAHFTEEDADVVEAAAKSSPQKKVGPYIAEAVRQRLTAEGHLPGTPAYDISAEARSAAEVAGAEKVLAALRKVTADAYKAPVEHVEEAA